MSDTAPYTPVRHARVTLSGLSHVALITSDDGAFTFPNLPGGRYRLTASKPGYAPTPFGTRPGRDIEVPVALAEGQQIASLTIRLARGGVISGTLRGTSQRARAEE